MLQVIFWPVNFNSALLPVFMFYNDRLFLSFCNVLLPNISKTVKQNIAKTLSWDFPVKNCNKSSQEILFSGSKLLQLYRAQIYKQLRSPGVDSQESILPTYVVCRAGTTNIVIVTTLQLHKLVEPIPCNRFLGSSNVYKFGLCCILCVYGRVERHSYG